MRKTLRLSRHTLVTVSKEHLSCTHDGETVLMSIEHGQYY